MERYLAGLVALLLFSSLAAFFGYIPIVPVILSVLILTAMLLMFLLGVWVGANVEFLAEAHQANPDAATNEQRPPSPNDSTKLAA